MIYDISYYVRGRRCISAAVFAQQAERWFEESAFMSLSTETYITLRRTSTFKQTYYLPYGNLLHNIEPHTASHLAVCVCVHVLRVTHKSNVPPQIAYRHHPVPVRVSKRNGGPCALKAPRIWSVAPLPHPPRPTPPLGPAPEHATGPALP